jgi:hypothetical protein
VRKLDQINHAQQSENDALKTIQHLNALAVG